MGNTLAGPLAPVTLRMVTIEMPPKLALMVFVPAATEVASPLLPETLLIVATDVDDELHMAVVVRF